MKNNDNNVEEMLLNNTSLDELIKKKIETEFQKEMLNAKKVKEKKVITDISKVPYGKAFSKEAVYKVFNRENGQETFINGLQAEAMTGVQHAVHSKILKGELSAFTTDSAYVKFEKIIIG